ncbi:2-oxo-4-hydroxy-4-carboxy-5-ureidoimidazoline decarboxylase [Aestuariibacter sp. GS-14]|uniref:2-oxo-4-hydroxy-4-carboxy-5-ureidoimidazoline decarboxylase n=1 Tax=Alteromonadaceae TaxID=72275 RepID=UPI00112B0300|nr:2-oxo-4-hydroxy-4-carboxy-5-ureidoimidazoline decarboxylase [Aestuariibacter sp. GS-14]TPV55408.1 2-oxo-4-hydroxy-4-carboxy-5-ureidoimidazoline decarboxylase [Aestuariibacter sp. GS-14]
MTLEQLNSLPAQDAYQWFETTCSASNWCKKMAEQRPYSSINALKDTAKTLWATMEKADYLEAFEGHPMIGDVNSLRAKYANTQATAASEQQGTQQASEATLQQLHELNHAYKHKHGFIFIICATGLSAETMLNALKARLPNDTQTELDNAAAQQINITLLRIDKGLTPSNQAG